MTPLRALHLSEAGDSIGQRQQLRAPAEQAKHRVERRGRSRFGDVICIVDKEGAVLGGLLRATCEAGPGAKEGDRPSLVSLVAREVYSSPR